RRRCAAALGRLVRDQRAFQPRDLVLEHQLALLQPLDRQLVVGDVALQLRDRGVEVAMLEPQFGQLAGDLGGICAVHSCASLHARTAAGACSAATPAGTMSRRDGATRTGPGGSGNSIAARPAAGERSTRRWTRSERTRPACAGACARWASSRRWWRGAPARRTSTTATCAATCAATAAGSATATTPRAASG